MSPLGWRVSPALSFLITASLALAIALGKFSTPWTVAFLVAALSGCTGSFLVIMGAVFKGEIALLTTNSRAQLGLACLVVAILVEAVLVALGLTLSSLGLGILATFGGIMALVTVVVGGVAGLILQFVQQSRLKGLRGFLRFSLRGLLVLVLICAATIWLVIEFLRGQKAPLPPSVSISRFTASISQSISGEERIERFEVPESFYEPILEELKIASFDPKPKKWEGMGGLTITHADQKVLTIGLYLIRASDGWEFAYSLAGPPRRYYRGGDALALEKLIRAAHRSQKGK
jgi:hypothetical protein